MAYANYTFVKPNPTDGNDSELAYWVAATVHNTVIEQREYAEQDHMAAPPLHLNILLSNFNTENSRSSGSTPLWNKCNVLAAELPTLQAFVEYFIAEPSLIAAPMGTLVDILKKETDISINYLANHYDYNCELTSAVVKSLAYHELGHASHYSQVGCNFWYTYRSSIASEIFLGNGSTKPYGDGTEPNAGIIAVGEMWGWTIEHIYTDRHYGDGGATGPLATGGFTSLLQGTYWLNYHIFLLLV
ncbi:MAG: hypothetical protein ABI402_17550 [Ferruginibacter sp.]